MVWKFPGKVLGKSEIFWITEMQTIQPKILEILGAKSNRQAIHTGIFAWMESTFEVIRQLEVKSLNIQQDNFLYVQCLDNT